MLRGALPLRPEIAQHDVRPSDMEPPTLRDALYLLELPVNPWHEAPDGSLLVEHGGVGRENR